jgi:hypothetical protein
MTENRITPNLSRGKESFKDSPTPQINVSEFGAGKRLFLILMPNPTLLKCYIRNDGNSADQDDFVR